MTRHISKRMATRSVLVGMSATLISLPGCAFFGVEYSPCFEDGVCDSHPVGDGDVSTGGSGDGDGDGDWPTGGSGDGDLGVSGGSDSGGGAGGSASGGNDVGGSDSGGMNSGGMNSGGSPAGGSPSGGSPSGGSPSGGGTGGSPSGGGGTGGVPLDVLQLQRDLKINEIRHGANAYVELYNEGDATLDLTEVFIAVAESSEVGPDYINDCSLSGESLVAGGFLVAQTGSGDCVADAPQCVTGCPFTIGAGSVIYVLKGSGGASGAHEIDDRQYPSSGMMPAGSNSFQAFPDGSDAFENLFWTPGYSNE